MLLIAGVNIDLKDEKRETALHWAAENGHEAVMRLLLEHKADIDGRCTEGRRTGVLDGQPEAAPDYEYEVGLI
ncbi:hypothetical protein BKA56DRAFT_679471 [Ilyonectria sp. MPI-CAGE-AT-0026]|nr:hypothetical protein BKA56DRAFT_679471 [Ilyonectria sp. MPI-CAGE-AT-0026]